MLKNAIYELMCVTVFIFTFLSSATMVLYVARNQFIFPEHQATTRRSAIQTNTVPPSLYNKGPTLFSRMKPPVPNCR